MFHYSSTLRSDLKTPRLFLRDYKMALLYFWNFREKQADSVGNLKINTTALAHLDASVA